MKWYPYLSEYAEFDLKYLRTLLFHFSRFFAEMLCYLDRKLAVPPKLVGELSGVLSLLDLFPDEDLRNAIKELSQVWSKYGYEEQAWDRRVGLKELSECQRRVQHAIRSILEREKD